MRMWMVPTKYMCNNHLLGEHNEIHKFVGYLQTRKRLDGWVKNNCLQPSAIRSRHTELVCEMIKRNMNHNSCLPSENVIFKFCDRDYYEDLQRVKVDVTSSLIDLVSRCDECRKLFLFG